MFEPLIKFIPKTAARFGIGLESSAAKICHSFRMLTPELFPTHRDVDLFVRPASYKEGTLTINVESSAWAQEVIMRKTQIIKKLNDKAGKEVIKHLRTSLKHKSYGNGYIPPEAY